MDNCNNLSHMMMIIIYSIMADLNTFIVMTGGMIGSCSRNVGTTGLIIHHGMSMLKQAEIISMLLIQSFMPGMVTIH